MTAPRFELTSQRQKVSRLPTVPPGRPVENMIFESGCLLDLPILDVHLVASARHLVAWFMSLLVGVLLLHNTNTYQFRFYYGTYLVQVYW